MTKTNFDRDDLSTIEEVFEDIAGQPWFDPKARYQFSRYLVEMFPNNSFNAKRHREIVEGVAHTLFEKKAEKKRGREGRLPRADV